MFGITNPFKNPFKEEFFNMNRDNKPAVIELEISMVQRLLWRGGWFDVNFNVLRSSQIIEIKRWCENNLAGATIRKKVYHVSGNWGANMLKSRYIIKIKTKEDAMAFKLKWM